MKKISISLLFIGLIFILEPAYREKLTFAVPYFDNSSSRSELVGKSDLTGLFATARQSYPVQTGHAPEPSTLLLLSGGIFGIVVRFVRKSFKKFKRGLDLVLATFGLAVVSPLLLLAGILIKLTSKGPIVYTQERVGKGGKIFKIYKLRTMVVDAEKGTGAVWAKKNDPRITKLGRILRKSRVDEIPQLFNVIKGEMSIIGPRPERPEMVRDFKELIHDYEKRLQIEPGITGLAQIWNRYDETITDVKKKVKYDLLYIKRMCMLTDLDILARTFVVVLTGKGAK